MIRITVLSAFLLAAAALPAQGLKPPTLLEGTAPDQTELDLRTTPVVRAVQRASDSVVSIYVLDPRSNDIRRGVDGQGSGVIIDKDGLVITNWHVVAQVVLTGRGKIKVRLQDERIYDASVLSSSAEHDLALLQLDLPDNASIKPAVAGRSESLMVGETVIAIGNPQGHAHTVTVGVLSAEDRSITVRAPDGVTRRYEGLLQTDAAINRGNSGGALLDITGKLIGINNAMAVGVENIGFAIPVDTVKKVFEDVLLSSDNLAQVWLGMEVSDDEGGPRVARVTPHGPAERAGVRIGDRVVSVRGKEVADKLTFARSIAGANTGRPIPILVERGRRRVEVTPRGLSNLEREIALRIGVEFEAVTADSDKTLLRQATLAFYSGSRRSRVPMLPLVLKLTAVYPDQAASELGLEVGDLIMGSRVTDWVGNTRDYPLRGGEDLADRLRDVAGRAMTVIILRDGEYRYGDMDVRRL